VLDDLTVLHQAQNELAKEPVHLFVPDPTIMIRYGGGGSGEGKNPPNGAVFTYYIAEKPSGPLTIEITNRDGTIVRTYSSEEGEFERCILGNMDQRLPFTVRYPPLKKGLNQWSWDFRRNGLDCIDEVKLFAGFEGASVIPGDYRVRFVVDGAESRADLTLLPDPRNPATPEDYAVLDQKLQEATDLLNQLLADLQTARTARSQLERLLVDHGEAGELREPAEAAIKRLTDWENLVTQNQYGTYEDEDSMPPMLDVQIRHVLDVMDRAGAPVSSGSLRRLEDLEGEWAERKTELDAITTSDIAAVNTWARTNGIGHVHVPGGR
jgi:hypothetical protein